jgi:fumarylacetoacetate (FAA) hydrolase
MKLATLIDGSRDGQLAVVSRDLTQAHYAVGIATTMRQLLDDWNFVSPQLEDLSATLNGGKARHAFAFDPGRCLPPLPRPVAWLRTVGEVLEAGAGGALAGARLTVPAGPAREPFELQPQLAVITADIPRGADPDAALEAVRLLLLAAEMPQVSADPAAWRLHTHARAAFGPVAVTPDELGSAWHRGRIDGRLCVWRAGRATWQAELGSVRGPGGFGPWLAAAAQQRPLAAGTLLAHALPARTPDGGADPEGPGSDRALRLSPGETLTLGLDTADAEAPLGRLTVSVEAPPAPTLP